MIYRGKDYIIHGTVEEIVSFFQMMQYMQQHPDERDLVMTLLNTILTRGGENK